MALLIPQQILALSKNLLGAALSLWPVGIALPAIHSNTAQEEEENKILCLSGRQGLSPTMSCTFRGQGTCLIISPCRNPEITLSFLFNILIYPFKLILKVSTRQGCWPEGGGGSTECPAHGQPPLQSSRVCAGPQHSHETPAAHLWKGEGRGGGKEQRAHTGHWLHTLRTFKYFLCAAHQLIPLCYWMMPTRTWYSPLLDKWGWFWLELFLQALSSLQTGATILSLGMNGWVYFPLPILIHPLKDPISTQAERGRSCFPIIHSLALPSTENHCTVILDLQRVLLAKAQAVGPATADHLK